MFTSLHARLKRASRLLPLALLPFAAHAQSVLNYSPSNSQYAAGTYTDLGTTGTVITTPNTDDANSAAQPIGFTFSYNGLSFTQFVLNTNGFLKLGASAPSASAMFLPETNTASTDPFQSTSAADVNIVAPFNFDLTAGNGTGGAEYRVSTIGTAPNRVCTIQWKNVSDKAGATATQYANLSFQVKLYETTNNVEFVYAAPTASGAAPAVRYTQAGLKGSGFNNGQFVQLSKTSATAWSGATFAGAITNNTLNTLNFRNNVNPTAGDTYRFQAGTACGDVSVTNITSTNNSIVLTATPGGGNTSYNVTYTAGGAVQTLTPAPTSSPITIPGLLPGTIYLVTIQGVCASGAGATLFGQIPTSGTAPAAAYATLPFLEGFEGQWANGLATRDLPSPNWRNTPAISDNSWRREDDGASAFWSFLNADASTASPYATRFSTGAHSARFHTYGTDEGDKGTLELYVNLSGPGNKTLSFDYINPTGTDKLDVFISTDGGATFGAAPLLTATTNTTFTTKTVGITSSSATTVIRFQATSDFEDDDMGIDNVQVRVLTATRNEALAATVSLSPNPAHGSFTLGVPAGSLRVASATLINALGQVVQTRQLNLPAAGGNADFDVSRLAAGIYSLQLKSGNDLVVKRVVVE